MQQTLGPGRGLKPLGRALLLAASISALTGCVSAVSTDLAAEKAAADIAETDDAGQPAAAVAASAEIPAADPYIATAGEAGGPVGADPDGDMAGLVMQSTSLNAGQASIYSTGTAAAAPGYAAQPSAHDATVNSLYSGAPAGGGAAQAGRLPVEDMPVLPSAGDDLSAIDPGAQSARMALVAEETVGGVPQTRRVLKRDSAAAFRTASLAPVGLPADLASELGTDEAHSEAEEDFHEEEPAFKEVASLAGLARLAPNGLWLQTEKVRTGCFKPELLDVLKNVEQHYGKPVIVTSGLRDEKPNRRKQSLHTRCEAADIQIAGVGKWELAAYLRSLPERGGVGTYCHTESVHIDVGPARDWNWRCRRRK